MINASAITGLTTALTVAQGGTGATSLAANNVLLGNNTSAVQAVAPGTSGNVLTSNGTTWTSAAPSGGVTSLNGQTGAITNTDYGAIGSYVIAAENDYAFSTQRLPDVTVAGSALVRSGAASGTNTTLGINGGTGQSSADNGVSSATAVSLGLSGTWRRMTRSINSSATTNSSGTNLYVRIS